MIKHISISGLACLQKLVHRYGHRAIAKGGYIKSAQHHAVSSLTNPKRVLEGCENWITRSLSRCEMRCCNLQHLVLVRGILQRIEGIHVGGSEQHPAGNFDALAIEPASTFGKQRRSYATNVIREPITTQ